MQAADDLITAGNQMIVAPGFKFDEAITKLQEQYPDIKICHDRWTTRRGS